MKRLKRRCFYCGKVLTRKTATTDHKRALSLGGSAGKQNRVDCCHSCNTRKGCLTYEEFRIVSAFVKGLVKTKMKFFGEIGEKI